MVERIEAPQRRSTRVLYKATVFVQWCKSSKVDFNSPYMEQIAHFLVYLFQKRNLQPSTIDGYNTAIADKVGNSSLNREVANNVS